MTKAGVNIWMVISLVLIGALLFIAGTFFPNLLTKKPSATPSPTLEQKITPISPAPTITLSQKITPTTKTEEKPIIDQLKQAFATKYSKPIGDVQLTVNKNTGTHATGGVKFSGEISGAMWLAYKSDEGWIIVHDGQGTIPCETIAPYDFPSDMVPECIDKDGNLITR